MSALLEARDLVRTFPAGGGSSVPVTAVRGISLGVARGELLGLAGPSGSGKTTLLHLLATIDTPSAGCVLLDGKPISALPRAERARLRLARIGLVFSEHNLSPALSVAENVDLPLALAGRPVEERRARVAAALDRLGIAQLADRRPDALSSGEQQRAAIARAVAGEPAVLLADEPTAHLDAATTDVLLEALVALVAERGLAAVITSHDERVLQRCTRVLRLADGRLGEPAR